MTEELEYCNICSQNDISKPYFVWCSDCEQTFCLECRTYHSSIQATKDHFTIPIKVYYELNEYIGKISTYCQNHDKKFQSLCQFHNIPLCLLCTEHHSDCEGVTPLYKIITEDQISKTINDIEESLKDVDRNVSKVYAYLASNLECIHKEKQAILTEIENIRQGINQHLDKIEDCLKKDVSDLHIKVTSKIKTTLETLEEKREKSKYHQKQVQILRNYGSSLETFLALRNISSTIDLSELGFKRLRENGSFDKVSLGCDTSDSLTHLSSEIKKFGEVLIRTTACNVPLQEHNQQQTQDEENITAFNNLKLRLMKSFDTPSKDTYGCEVLSRGKMLFTDYSNDGKCVFCTDPEGKPLLKVPTSLSRAFDITYIDDNSIAVTSGQTKILSIVDIGGAGSVTIKKVYNIGYECYGVTHREGTILVCALHHGIMAVSLEDGKITTIIQSDLPYYSYITSYKDRMYFTDWEKHTVTCCNMAGHTIWTFKDDHVLHSPFGITIDTCNIGRIYVSDKTRNTVILLSDNGKKSKILLSKDDGINSCYALSFDNKRNHLLVTNKEERAFLYDVSACNQ